MLQELINKKLDELKYDKKIFHHGLQIIIYDGIGLISVLIQSIFFHNFLFGIIYILIFSHLRIHAGGYHASTKSQCFLIYNCLFLFFMLTLKSIIFAYLFNFILTGLSSLFIIRYAPVQHIYSPLSQIEKYKNKDKLRISLFFILLFYIILLVLQINIYKPISISIIYTALLMALHMKTKYYRGY
ncbi:accessory gene regulator B family protein [Anaerorhabdus sp.]|uniref:accessory gene regulator B family protein n=1 Tax=Anaerorhabdus sp. TaxID=1872524 RepID=UPI003FA60AC3